MEKMFFVVTCVKEKEDSYFVFYVQSVFAYTKSSSVDAIFQQEEIDGTQLRKLFGSLLPFPITKKEVSLIRTATASSPGNTKLYTPRLITSTETGFKILYNVACNCDEEFWASGEDSKIKCFDGQGSLLNAVDTTSGIWPNDIAVTNEGDLLYIDGTRKTIELMKNGQKKRIITLLEWNPLAIFVTSGDELLIIMFSDDETQSKVVRYSGSNEKQSFLTMRENLYIQEMIKYITENGNCDICVADFEVSAVVVVNKSGKFRFRYTCYPFAAKENPFSPCGIATDRQNQILIADCANHCIHIVDQDGQFLHYIEGCGLDRPCGLCVDKNDNLLVAETNGILKKIKYQD
ncbi:tripartite motif-containing protein 2-like [Saccostrea echinata]|uniref:tripartite motif-containing protein 2-like n=1 Tax=Saccostrea echinata TaxID=191078 RepID=UPI002A82E77C|nr:tripartite motif-containing protein 2-like [Saccostrea echinata]